jgi:L-ascorbate metabolism protein UlaG (beta-lactamase superfamily)
VEFIMLRSVVWQAVFVGLGVVPLLEVAATAQGQDAQPQEPKKDEPALKLRWFGQSFFQLETVKGFKIVFDPHAIPVFGRPLVKADYVLISHPHNDHNLVEVLEGREPKKDDKGKATAKPDSDVYHGVVEPKPGRQEWKPVDEKRGQIRFRNLGTFHDAVNGLQRGKNSVWIVEVDGLVFCHLGDLGHELTPEQVKAIGKVDVLMIPVGGIYTLNGDQAKTVVEQLKPRLYVLPMHYGVPGYDDLLGPEEFLGGQKNVKKLTTTNELVIPPDLKADAPTVVLLGWTKEAPKEPKK